LIPELKQLFEQVEAANPFYLPKKTKGQAVVTANASENGAGGVQNGHEDYNMIDQYDNNVSNSASPYAVTHARK